MIPSLERLRAAGEISPLDAHFARAIADLAGETRPEIRLALEMAAHEEAERRALAGELVELLSKKDNRPYENRGLEFGTFLCWSGTTCDSNVSNATAR